MDLTQTAGCDVPPALTNWILSQPPGDTTPLDMQLVRLAKNKSNNTGDPVAFNTYPLSSFIGDVANHYQLALETLDIKWRAIIKDQILTVDDKAREILNNLAQELASCEFSMPAQVCVTVDACAIQPNVVSVPCSPSAAAAQSASLVPFSVGNNAMRDVQIGNRTWKVRS